MGSSIPMAPLRPGWGPAWWIVCDGGTCMGLAVGGCALSHSWETVSLLQRNSDATVWVSR